MTGTRRVDAGETTSMPSTAESTEIAGVIIPSPKNSEAPKMPSATSATSRGCRRSATRRTSAIRARIPPSPCCRPHDHVDGLDRDDDRDDQNTSEITPRRRPVARRRGGRPRRRSAARTAGSCDVAEDDAERPERERGHAGVVARSVAHDARVTPRRSVVQRGDHTARAARPARVHNSPS